ncbi:sigma factor [Streptomyces sp. NPDC086010]|uniref:sigma factor n=1 Tax=Streptomyces sp. NPDC086010 TaxID=3365745 RepID=UPI0037D49070
MYSDGTYSAGSLDEAVCVFLPLRPRLWAAAYRVLGSSTEAEDVVQDVWVRWQNTDRSQVLAPPAFLRKTTVRLAINVTKSAHWRRETCSGLPDMVVLPGNGPEAGAEQAEGVDEALLLLMERLGPVERAAYLLREAFDYPYVRIAGILRLTQVNTRQLVSRARRNLAGPRRAPVSSVEHRRLRRAFLDAARFGDMASLERLLAADAVGRPGERAGADAARDSVLTGSRPDAARRLPDNRRSAPATQPNGLPDKPFTAGARAKCA